MLRFLAVAALLVLVAVFSLDAARPRGGCASCQNGVCSVLPTFESPVVTEAAPVAKAADDCKCGLACPCKDAETVAYYATPYATPVVDQKQAFASGNCASGACASGNCGTTARPGLLRRIFHRRR